MIFINRRKLISTMPKAAFSPAMKVIIVGPALDYLKADGWLIEAKTWKP